MSTTHISFSFFSDNARCYRGRALDRTSTPPYSMVHSQILIMHFTKIFPQYKLVPTNNILKQLLAPKLGDGSASYEKIYLKHKSSSITVIRFIKLIHDPSAHSFNFWSEENFEQDTRYQLRHRMFLIY